MELGNGTLYTTLLKLPQNLVVEYFRWTVAKKSEESVETLIEWALRVRLSGDCNWDKGRGE